MNLAATIRDIQRRGRQLQQRSREARWDVELFCIQSAARARREFERLGYDVDHEDDVEVRS